MSDLISVSSLLKNSAQIEFANTDGTVGMYINVKAVKLEQQYNSIDAVEVVRCKKCKFSDVWNERVVYCKKHTIGMNTNDFCSYGERKDEVSK